MNDDKIRCPCRKARCRNKKFVNENDLRLHLYKNGFVENYYTWIYQGEEEMETEHMVEQCVDEMRNENEEVTMFEATRNMVAEIAGPSYFQSEGNEPNFSHNEYVTNEAPNAHAQTFFDMISNAEKALWPGNNTHSQLSASFRMLDIKCKHQVTESCYNDMCDFLQEVLPEENTMPVNLYETKKIVKELGLPMTVIHSCENNCMLFWGEDIELQGCKICGHPRYKPHNDRGRKRKVLVPFKKMHYFPLIPRLQRLYASRATASEMRWHAEHV